MDIKNLITFIHVAELSSFTKAAKELGFSQSTVSFQIKQLEEELKSQLFERINHTVVLTDKGREVLRYAHQMSKLTQELKENMQNETAIAGHIRLGMADSLRDSLLSKGFDSFRERYPGITLKIIAVGTEEMFRLLNHNEVDAILTLDNHICNTEYVIVREEKVGMHFVAGRNILKSQNILRSRNILQGQSISQSKSSSITVQNLTKLPFILTEKGMSYRRLMDEKLAEMSLEIQPVLEIGSPDMICTLVEQGIGISFLPDYVTEKAVQEGRMVYLNVADFEIDIWKQLLYHRDKWVSPQMESVLQYCVSKEFFSGRKI